MKKRIISIFLLLALSTIFVTCEIGATQQGEKEFQTGYQEWEDFVLKSLEINSKTYNIVQSSDEELYYDDAFYTDFYDKQGNMRCGSEYIGFSNHSWYILEADTSGDITFDFKSVKGIQYGLQNWASGAPTPVYYTNRIVNTAEFGVAGFNLSAINGGLLHDYNFHDFSDEYEDELKEVAFPIVVGATEFVTTKILSRKSGVTEEYNWAYVEFEIARVVVEFSNNLERAIVRTYNFSVRYGSDDADKITILDDIYNSY
jgi:hypothetical protein